MDGYTYEIWTLGDDPQLAQWGTYTVDDLTYRGDDLAQVAAEIASVRLPPPPFSPAEGEFRLWPEATGNPIPGEPDYVGDVVTLRAG